MEGVFIYRLKIQLNENVGKKYYDSSWLIFFPKETIYDYMTILGYPFSK